MTSGFGTASAAAVQIRDDALRPATEGAGDIEVGTGLAAGCAWEAPSVKGAGRACLEFRDPAVEPLRHHSPAITLRVAVAIALLVSRRGGQLAHEGDEGPSAHGLQKGRSRTAPP
jgi:hypothetical protein